MAGHQNTREAKAKLQKMKQMIGMIPSQLVHSYCIECYMEALKVTGISHHCNMHQQIRQYKQTRTHKRSERMTMTLFVAEELIIISSLKLLCK